MRAMVMCVLALSMVSGRLAAAAETKPAPATGAATARPATQADRDGWPDTRVGTLAHGWVEAFSTGEEAMKDYLANHLAASSLASKSLPQRVERYRDLRERYGALQLISVVKAKGSELTVKLMASDATSHEFVFTAQDEAPYKLVSVAIKQPGHFGHGMFGH